MPPKRPLRRPTGPTTLSRTPLHAQELILFSSPIANASAAAAASGPTKRTASTHRRFSGPSASTATAVVPPAGPASKTHGASDRRRGAPPQASTSTSLSSAIPSSSPSTAIHRPVAEYEPLPANYRTVPSGPTSYSSDIARTPPSSSSTRSSGPVHTGGRVPSPPPTRSGEGHGGIVASGASSRVVRLLRDARAAVQDPIRPETPLDAFKPVGGSTTRGGDATAGGSSSSFLPQQPTHGLESRLRRRLPAGGRLAPVPPSASPTATPLRSSATPTTLPVNGGLSSEIDLRTHQHRQHCEDDNNSISVTAAGGHHASALSAAPLDAEEFARRYTAAQQRGEDGLLECLHLLGQLREWLAVPPNALGATATGCLQSTLLHFSEYWPTGDALRNAVDNYSALNGGVGESVMPASVVPMMDGRRGSRAVNSSVPLNYAEVALVAATVMLRSYPVMSLLAEPVSFHALLAALHTTATCGVAEWITQESDTLEVLVDLLRALAPTTGTAGEVTRRNRQWMLWILEIFACCCEEASFTAATAAATASASATATMSPSKKSGSAPSGFRMPALRATTAWEQDMIRGQGFADELSEAVATTSGQQRAASASLISSSTSLPRVMQPQADRAGPHAPLAGGVAPQGSPLSVLRRGGSGGEGQGVRLSSFASVLEAVTAHLMSLNLLRCLQDLSAQMLQEMANTPPSTTVGATPSLPATPASLLAVTGTLYRLLTPFHADALRASGAVGTLVTVLQVAAADSAAVESAARALVKLSFNEACLAGMQAIGVVLIDAVAHALLAQLRLHPTAGDAPSLSIELLVSRLCGVMARVAEGSGALQEHLTTPAITHVLEILAQRYLAVRCAEVHMDRSLPPSPSALLSSTPLLQSIVWVLGMAAMSPRCSLHLVGCVTPLLVTLLRHLREVPSMHTTAVYVLMCLSNLSYFFNRFESDSADSEMTAADGAEWLSSVCNDLGFSLAAFLFEDSVEATVEATRVLGNISYTNAGRDWMEANHCDEVVVLFLGHEDLRIVYNCCGVLLNLTAASPCRVVEDPELLRTMLSYTARYTKDDSIAAAAALERERLRRLRRAAEGAARKEEDEGECAEEASSSADQIADLVEKLLMNVQGLLNFAASV